MEQATIHVVTRTGEAAEKPRPLRELVYEWGQRGWRPAGTLIAVALAGLLMWHVVSGKDGLSVWQQKRAESRELQKQIQDLQQENAQLKQRIDRLQSDPDAIEHEARETLHYAKPGEVIYVGSAGGCGPAERFAEQVGKAKELPDG